MVRQRISRRQRLVAVGIELFSNQLYEEVSIDTIAEVADISKGLLYYYFPTKHDFYVAVVQHAAEQLLQETDADPQLSPLERLRTSLNAYFSYAQHHAKAYIALLRGGAGVDAQVMAIMDNVRQTYAQRIIQSIIGDAPLIPAQRMAIDGWIGFVEATSVAWLERRDLSREELCDLAMTTFRIVFYAPAGVTTS